MSSTLDQPVVIAVDPPKASWTAAAVSAALAPLATITVQVGAPGYRQLRRFAERWPAVMWAIEGASGPGGRWPLVGWRRDRGGGRAGQALQHRPPRPVHPALAINSQRIRRRPVLGGLISEYERAA